MHAEVKDPDDKVVLSRIYSAEGEFRVDVTSLNVALIWLALVWTGRISFTSHTPGEHTICLYSNSSAWFSGSQLRVHMDIQVGEHAIDYAQVAQKEKMTELQLRIRQLLNQVDQITKEQNYQRVSERFCPVQATAMLFSDDSLFFQYREERFRATSESTNHRVLWWSLAQVIVLVGMGFWQMRHLKTFFETKKLV